MLLYLDNSVLNRPFDDQRQPRIWLETLAFSLVLSLIESGKAEMIHSSVHQLENDASPALIRRRFVAKCLGLAKTQPKLDAAVKVRAAELGSLGFTALDALHLASAEEAGVDYFLSCDDRVVRRYSGRMMVVDPQTFISTVGDKP